MAYSSQAPKIPGWSEEALALASQAKVLSGQKLDQLVTRIQRHSGRPREACWRLVIQYGIKDHPDYRRWTDPEFDTVREELVKASVEEVAKKIHRTPNAIRNMLRRNHLSLRDIRCDLFSVESLASALHVRKSEIIFWIQQDWLRATLVERGKRRFYTITPEALKDLYRHRHRDLMQRGMRNLALFEAYVEYCFVPKHTIGEQLLECAGTRRREQHSPRRKARLQTRRMKAMKTVRTWMGDIVSRWWNRTPAPTPESTTPERCPRCGAPIPSSKLLVREIVLSALCGSLLLLILIPVGITAEHWMEDVSHHFVDRMLWYEPLDRWDN